MMHGFLLNEYLIRTETSIILDTIVQRYDKYQLLELGLAWSNTNRSCLFLLFLFRRRTGRGSKRRVIIDTLRLPIGDTYRT